MAREFKSFTEAGAYFVRAAVIHETVKKQAMRRAGTKVLAHARSKFGVYQPAVGEWARWMYLTDYTMTERIWQGFTPDDPLKRSGGLKKSLHLSIDNDRIVIGSNDERMIWHEMGTSRMPPRAVLGPALYEKRHEVAKIIGHSIARHMMYGFVKAEDL